MKKFISMFISIALAIGLFSVNAFAVNYEDYSVPVYGVMRDAEGNILEVVQMTRGTYVNSVHTFPVGATFTTYQYLPKTFFNACIAFDDTNGNYIATPDGTIQIEVFNAESVGGQRNSFYPPESFSTNRDNYGMDNVGLIIDTLNKSRPYYNAVYTNTSDKAITIRLLLECDV